MSKRLSRRDFVKSSLFASTAIPLALGAQPPTASPARPSTSKSESPIPTGRIGNVEVSRLMMGGNLIAGWAHSRDLPYVSSLMRHYNTPAKIRQTLELGEQNGITAINTWVMDDNTQIFDHWKNGGNMKWFRRCALKRRAFRRWTRRFRRARPGSI